jgi:hypothetical protein
MKLSSSPLAQTLRGLALSATLALAPSSALAVGTRSFDLDSLDDLSGGDLTNVAIDSHGAIRAGFELGKVGITEAQSAWGSVLLPDGSVLIGTGNEGKILRVSNSQVSVAATTGEMAVTSLAVAWNGDVIAGSFPKGRLFKLPKGEGKGGQAAAFGTGLEGVEYIWALAFDPKSKSLYAATGPEGKVLRIDEQGRAQVHFDAEDAHIVSLAVAPDGTVYAGTSGKAMLFEISGPGRAKVLYDFDADDVSAIAVAKDGTVWATANKYSGSFSLPGKGSGGIAGPSASRPSKPGEGVLVRFKNGTPEEMMSDKKTHYQSLALDDAGVPYVGTGAEGRVYTVDDNHLTRLVADTDSRQVGSLLMAGKRRYLVGSDPVAFRDIKGEGGSEAVWTSKVLDAGMRASFGNLTWRGAGSVEISTRSGSTQEPDASWSSWTVLGTAPGKVKSPPGRYVQMRARFAKDPKAFVNELHLAFVTDNARAIVSSISAESKVQKRGSLSTGMVSSGGKAPKPSSTVSLKWDVENPDKDELRYRISYRLEGQTTWRDALKPAEIFTGTSYEWDTSALPEGLYRVRVEATDELVNPPDRVTRHSLESSTVLVDNTPPVFKSISLSGRKLSGEVQDGLGPISRIEVSIAGTDDWRPIFPTDLVFDDPSEKFDTDLSSLVPPGSKLIAVRAYDQAGNSVSKELEAK